MVDLLNISHGSTPTACLIGQNEGGGPLSGTDLPTPLIQFHFWRYVGFYLRTVRVSVDIFGINSWPEIA